ncbi:MAG: bifunctional riboflavin kinase/FAD synthetase [Cyanobacteria bacterium J06641_5]
MEAEWPHKQAVRIVTSPVQAVTPAAIALGNFDGVHRGHQEVIRPILDDACLPGLPTVVTFDPHPREFFSGERRLLLTPQAEKAAFLAALGIKQWILLRFNRQLAALSPEAFVAEILAAQLQATCVSVGKDFHFGKQRAGTAQDLKELCQGFEIDTRIVDLAKDSGDRISSSRIRQALTAGDIATAHDLLGRDYMLTGTVVTGQQLGREIGFPTANLQVPAEKFLPRHGVYSVRVSGPGLPEILGVMNLGCRPTVNGQGPTLEVHLLDWSGDLYGQDLTVRLQQFLRAEQKFPSLSALKTQIAADCEAARSALATC